MFGMNRQSATKRFGLGSLVGVSLAIGMTVMATEAGAQEAIGVPFIGENHLAFYTTQMSRDGVGQEKAAVFGAVYGHRFGDRHDAGEVSVLVRAGARAFDECRDRVRPARRRRRHCPFRRGDDHLLERA